MYLKILSGGQSGVDRAALDVALERHLPCDVVGQDDTFATARLILVLLGGPEDTSWAIARTCRGSKTQYVQITVMTRPHALHEAADWWQRSVQGVGPVFVTGPREEDSPGVYKMAVAFLRRLFDHLDGFKLLPAREAERKAV